ncbi:nucleotidyltransferase domain-containing protein [Candidatus Woesearchaeota archaeon]|nr:nucleotidyltransferase domain-containing protein [Candidatus Woesearchaeota archaeon]
MKKWEKSVNKFLIDWKNKNGVIGALVCGSYVTGKPSKNSDIDVHIILSDKLNWRERGNKIIDGFLIEYFANPPKQIKKYFEEDFKGNHCMSYNQFITGKTLFDYQGIIKDLKILAWKYKKRKFSKLDKINLEIQKYKLWDNLDNLRDNYSKDNIDFYYIYYNFLNEIYKTYSKYVQYPISDSSRVYDLFTKRKTREKYLQNQFSDKLFIKLFIEALKIKSKDKMIKSFEEVVKHVFINMGGFDIDGWKIKSPVEKSTTSNN